MHMYICVYRERERDSPGALGGGAHADLLPNSSILYKYVYTTGFHNFNLRIFNLRVSNPNKLIVDVFF